LRYYKASILKIRSESNVEPGQNKTVSEGFLPSCNESNEFADLSVKTSAQASMELMLQENQFNCNPTNKKQ